MGWQKKANAMSMGKFVRAKKNQMVIITFTGEPEETIGKNFNGQEVDELQFPVTFYEMRATNQRYESGEPARIVEKGQGEAKLFPVQGGPLLRALMEVEEAEGLIGNTFIVKHTGEGQNTAYTFTQVIARKQTRVVEEDDEEEPKEVEEIPEERDPDDAKEHAGPNPRKEPIKQPSKDLEKEKFMKEVEKRTRQSRKQNQSESQDSDETKDKSG